MTNRLTKIYTRTGDNGTTGMADGSRLSKADLRFEAMGKIDSLNSHIGMVNALLKTVADFDLTAELNVIQHLLFNIGGELAMPEFQQITATHTATLERQIDVWNATLPRLQDFILPAGSVAVCQVHIARCACREAERALVAVHERDNNIASDTLAYINRLSDWLFVLARQVAKAEGNHEILWQKT